jgi:hypothetical protein
MRILQVNKVDRGCSAEGVVWNLVKTYCDRGIASWPADGKKLNWYAEMRAVWLEWNKS